MQNLGGLSPFCKWEFLTGTWGPSGCAMSPGLELISEDSGHHPVSQSRGMSGFSALSESLVCPTGIKKDPTKAFVPRTVMIGGKVR